TADCNRDINAVCLGRGDKVQVRIEIAGERYRALAQDDALAENSQASADKTETAYRLDRGDRAGEADGTAHLGIKATATDEDARGGVNGQVEPHHARPAAGHRRAVVRAGPLQRLDDAGWRIHMGDVD